MKRVCALLQRARVSAVAQRAVFASLNSVCGARSTSSDTTNNNNSNNNDSAKENGWSDLISFTAASVLIGGSAWWVMDSFNKDGSPKILSNAYNQSNDNDNDEAFNLPYSLWAMIRNVFLYPAVVRSPLRSALYNHYYSNSSDSAANAEKNYLQAYTIAKTVLPEHSNKVVGIALQIASFYEDCSAKRRVQAIEWYKRALKSLIAHSCESPFDWSSSDGVTRLKQISQITTKLAELTELDSPVNRFPQESEQWYTYALKTLILPADRLSSHFSSLLAGTDDKSTIDEQPISLTTIQELKRAFLQPLLSNMSDFYKRYHIDSLALPLYLQLLAILPDDRYDPLCRRAQVMNNMAESYVKLWESRHQKDRNLLNEAQKWLENAMNSIQLTSSRSMECGHCDVIVVNNLGKIHELHGDLIKALEFYRRAVNSARQREFLEGRREAQENVDRVQELI